MYGFSQHKGYPTSAHREAVSKFGPCAIHRMTFGPVKRAIEAQQIAHDRKLKKPKIK